MALETYQIDVNNLLTFAIRLDKNDLTHRDVLAHLSHGQLYEHETSMFFIKALRKGDTVIDIGANAGYFSLLSSTIVDTQGRVLSLEANPASVAIILDNARINQKNNIDVVQCAVSDHTGSVVFNVNGSKDSNGAVMPTKNVDDALVNNESTKEFIADSRKIDDILDERSIKSIRIMKIDTEGHDLHVLRGAHDFLERKAIDFIICELNLPGLKRNGESQANLIKYMKEYGYNCFLLDHEGGIPLMVPYGVKILQDYTCNILFAREESIHSIWPTMKNSPASMKIKDAG